MARKVLQVLVLPLLFALLGVGGNTTYCAVLSLVGLEAHHHFDHAEGASGHAGPFCLESHEEEDRDHGHEGVPCPESCEIRLSEAPAPGLMKLPVLAGACTSAVSFELPMLPVAPSSDYVPGVVSDPPEGGPPLASPSFTGRYLI